MTKSNNSLELIDQFLKDLNAIELASNSGGGIFDALQTARDHAQRFKSEILDVKMETMPCDDNSKEVAVSGSKDEEENNSKLNRLQLAKENNALDTVVTDSDKETGNVGDVPADNAADSEQQTNDADSQDETASTELENQAAPNSPVEMSETENKEDTTSSEAKSAPELTQSTLSEVQAAGEDASQSTDAIQLV